MIKKMIKTFERYKPYCMDIIRIYLGFGLFLKGCVFIMHGELLDNYIVILGPYLDILHIKFLVFFLAHYIVFGHLAGGLLLLFGLLTRIAAFVQIPILAGAVFLSTLTDGIFSETQSLSSLGIR